MGDKTEHICTVTGKPCSVGGVDIEAASVTLKTTAKGDVQIEVKATDTELSAASSKAEKEFDRLRNRYSKED